MRVLAVCLSLSLLATSSSAEGPRRAAIRDGLNLFSKQAIAKAEQQIHEIHADSGIELIVDTTKDAPPEARGKKPSIWLVPRRWSRAEALDDWARTRADEFLDGKNPGVYVVVIDTNPGQEVRLVVWPRNLGLKVFWNRQRDLRNAFERELKKDPDLALHHLVANYREQMDLIKEHPVPLRTVPALILIGGLVALWLLAMAVRWRAAAQVRSEREPVAIYQPAMLATLFGVPAAFWINDELFRVIPPEVTPVERSAESDSFTLPPAPLPLDASQATSDRPPTV